MATQLTEFGAKWLQFETSVCYCHNKSNLSANLFAVSLKVYVKQGFPPNICVHRKQKVGFPNT